MFAQNAIGFWSASGAAPIFVSAVVENATPTKVTLTYDQALDETSIPDTTDFTVTSETISGVSVSGTTVELILAAALTVFDAPNVTYTAGANPIKGSVGGVSAANLGSTAITNNIEGLIPHTNGFDFPDSNSDGYGNGWAKLSGGGSGSIVIGNGFTGNAQRFTHVLGTNSSLQYTTGVTAVIGTTYKVKGKFRAGNGGWRLRLRNTLDEFTSNMSTNTGDAIAFELTVVATGATEIILTFFKATGFSNTYLEIDEIQLSAI